MHIYLTELLECPRCRGRLEWRISEQAGTRIETAEAYCQDCATTYPVRESIGLFLVEELPRVDLWEQAESGLARALRQHPDLERQLMQTPLESLAPADQLFRAMVLEERGQYGEGKVAQQLAHQGLYTEEYLGCWQGQIDFVVERVSAAEGPVVDLASGRGYLLELLARNPGQPLVGTDFSPRVLRGNRSRLESLGLYDQVSLLAFDARQTPFKRGSVPALTTNVGLPNIQQPGELLAELRRIVDGRFLAISHFYPEDDAENGAALQEAGLAELLYRRAAVERFAAAGWQVDVANVCRGRAEPTPPSRLFDGARPDAFPVTPTRLEWCVLIAR